MEIPPEVSKYMSEMAKLSHKKSPRPKSHYSRAGKIGTKGKGRTKKPRAEQS